eukprot:5473458-Prymnesium_polylepis.1
MPPPYRNGLRTGQSANPDVIAAIDSNRRGSYIRCATLTVIQNAHRAGGTVERELAPHPTPKILVTHCQKRGRTLRKTAEIVCT